MKTSIFFHVGRGTIKATVD